MLEFRNENLGNSTPCSLGATSNYQKIARLEATHAASETQEMRQFLGFVRVVGYSSRRVHRCAHCTQAT